MARIALGIEYDGSTHFGWQRQRNVPSIQGYLENALSVVANKPIGVQCAGRTDAGVHATGQVVHFDFDDERPERAWTMGVNANLPDSVAVTWCKTVDDNFHARFSATHRRYRYIIKNTRLRPAILCGGVTHIYQPLDEKRMHEAAQALLGEQDFTSFRAALCQSKTPFRNVTHVSVSRMGDFVIVDIRANAFLHHMVRNIVGSLIEIGAGEQPVSWIAELLLLKDRTKAAATAKPNGLYLVDVTYPQAMGIPQSTLGPLFLPDN
ncbi:tRNA pseudouridine(38-40) synthase TruA [Aestuariibacter sp. A3R04]|uniref:tRNA pseudouridine(38-40) synthase TruA n=1 Tax=Aestuariibacter sp. A3R04 TaxID=2841571 RepID=UPI001C08D3E2|nr:tRNA pseudouridine(38-40) synthase TruA [Aestuariibacter sp. A3R04]MBU3023304.1 tRNA pseudouridine(38-40) synthase TruA [Aestuariibacter sp. A3R04]